MHSFHDVRHQLIFLLMLAACGGDDQTHVASFRLVAGSADAALMSIAGTTAEDVWAVGADRGDGPLVLHWDGLAWEQKPTSVSGDLWWVHALPNGTVYMSGSDALVLEYRDGAFERMDTPGLGKDIVFGVWAASNDDVYAVGSAQGRNGFIWHFDGASWRDLPLPAGVPLDDNADAPSLFKIWGASSEDVWVVGDRGVVLRGNARSGFRLVPSGSTERLFTVHGGQGQVAIVGGSGNGWALEASADGLLPITPPGSGLLQGVCVSEQGSVWAVGAGGNVFTREASGSEWRDVPTNVPVQSLHAVWVDPDGGTWTVGGNVLTNDLDQGVVLYRDIAGDVASTQMPPREVPAPACPQAAIDPAPETSIARRWNEQLLGAIRRDVPRPTVHARNLFHTSLAMWDAWAAYDDTADGYVLPERHTASDVAAARREALSYAAYRVLSHRYAPAVGGAVSQACFDAFMVKLGYDVTDASVSGDAPRALGNRIGQAVIAAFEADGANERNNYADPVEVTFDNPLLPVDLPGTVLDAPARWQPLVLAEAVTQNGIALGSGAQGYIGSHWGDVVPFALVRPAPEAPYLDIGRAPTALDDELVAAAVEVIRKTAELDIEDGVRQDLSPGGYGNNTLGANDGQGHAENPITGLPYTPQRVLRGDFTRVLAEFWADGPASETPPGHWNTLANSVSYDARFERRLFGDAAVVLDPLAWDVHVYLALNGAVHDAAIAAWELKRVYTTARPISLIRYMAGLGQRSDPAGPAYHAEGLPLVPGLIEVISAESSAPGERHAQLARYVGEIALRSWPGEPGNREHQVAEIRWMRARDWMPYQRRNFVTPAFPGYVSGHSTFSRAAAVVLHQLTGSEYFPGGLGSARFEPGYLVFEYGPSEPIELQWATYYDASDQAGQSRLWGGIHVRQDDFDGRRVGARVGELAIERATSYFDGSARP